MSRSRSAGPDGSPSGPACGTQRRRTPRHPWRAPLAQLLSLAVVLSVGLSVRDDAVQDVAADRGVGPVVPVRAVERKAAPPVSLQVPRLGVDTRLLGLRKDRSGRLQVPEDAARAGWYSQGPAPGDAGPAVIVGHVDSYRGPGVFHQLRTMRKGDQVVVRRADGTRARFVVAKVEDYAKRRFPTAEVYGGTTSGLRLITCGGAFDRATKSYLSNVVVFAVPMTAAKPPRRSAMGTAPRNPSATEPDVVGRAPAPAKTAPAAPRKTASDRRG